VVFAEPLGIHGIRERGAGSVQRGLRHCRQGYKSAQQKQSESAHRSMTPPWMDTFVSIGAILQDGYKPVNF
jgi:hypothetical protein